MLKKSHIYIVNGHKTTLLEADGNINNKNKTKQKRAGGRDAMKELPNS